VRFAKRPHGHESQEPGEAAIRADESRQSSGVEQDGMETIVEMKSGANGQRRNLPPKVGLFFGQGVLW